MTELFQPSFTDSKYTAEGSWQRTNALPSDMAIARAETQTGVNETVLNYLVQKFLKNAPLRVLDLPCGKLEFAGYLKQLFPQADITGIDILPSEVKPGIHFLQMDVSQPFTIANGEQYDIISSISGVMMFSNTRLFLENCISRLRKGGTFVLTNDNAATLKDKITFLLFGNLRMFPAVYADNEPVTENVPLQELVRILRMNGLTIKDIVYTSSNKKDYLIRPVAFLLFPLQRWFLRKFNHKLTSGLIKKMYPFRHLYCRHYCIFAEKCT